MNIFTNKDNFFIEISKSKPYESYKHGIFLKNIKIYWLPLRCFLPFFLITNGKKTRKINTLYLKQNNS